MLQLTPQTAVSYLRERGMLASDEGAEVRELPGGVSSTVLLVHRPGGEDFVLKQALPQLKVQQEWLCSPERIWREVEVLEICGKLLASGARLPSKSQPPDTCLQVPTILFSDPANYCYAMTAAPPGHKTWKELLLAGNADPAIAAACGRLLGALHAGSWKDAGMASRLADRTFFDALRLDPYYRRVAEVHPDLAPILTALIDETCAAQLSLVHGDFSPKNLLLSAGEIWLIDFEVGHFGDPAFDLGFFLTHLALKAVYAGPQGGAYLQLIEDFWASYQSQVTTSITADERSGLSRRAALHWTACLLARVDGKSPVDYLSPHQQRAVRTFAAANLLASTGTVEGVVSRLRRETIK